MYCGMPQDPVGVVPTEVGPHQVPVATTEASASGTPAAAKSRVAKSRRVGAWSVGMGGGSRVEWVVGLRGESDLTGLDRAFAIGRRPTVE